METAIATLSSPIILFFVLGLFAAFARSDLAIPEAVAKGLSIYLMIAIGLQGGKKVYEGGFSMELVMAALLGIALSFSLPLLAFALLRSFGRVDRTNAAAAAAHYGSVSVVTFVAATEILTRSALAPPGYMVAVLAMMETPAIVTGLLLAARQTSGAGSRLWREVLLNASVVLLVGAFLIGLVSGPEGLAPVSPLFDGLFRGILRIFLLDMGLVAGRRLIESRALTWRIASLAVALPVINGTIGVTLATLIGLDVAAAAALGILAASSSYIAVPAAMRLALPEADPGLYLSMSLGVTFPFNIMIGIPLFMALAQAIA